MSGCSVPAVVERLLWLPAGVDVEMDLSHVRSISAADVTVLMALRRHLAQDGAALYLAGASTFLDRALMLVGLRRLRARWR